MDSMSDSRQREVLRMESAPRSRAGDQERHEALALVRALDALAHHLRLEFDAVVAERLAWRALQAFPGVSTERAAARLAFAARNLGVQLAFRRTPLADALREASVESPVVFAGSPHSRDPWFIITARSGKKHRIVGLASEQNAVWIEQGDLASLLSLGPQREAWCALAAPLSPCESWTSDPLNDVDDPHDAHAPLEGRNPHRGRRRSPGAPPPRRLSPSSRLRRMLAPEGWELTSLIGFALAAGLALAAAPLAVASLVDAAAFGTTFQPILVLSGAMLAFLSLAAWMQSFQAYLVELMQRRFFLRLSGDLAARLPRLRQSTLERAGRHPLVSRFGDVLTVQKAVAGFLLDGLALAVQLLVGMVVLGSYHPWLLGYDVVLAVACLVVLFGLGGRGTAAAVEESKSKDAVEGWLEELVRSPLLFKSPQGADLASERTDALARDYLKRRGDYYRIVFRQFLAAALLQAAAAAGLLAVGGWLVIQGELSLGQLVASQLLVMLTVGAFNKSGRRLADHHELLAAVDGLGRLLDSPLERSGGEGVVGEGPMRVVFKGAGVRVGRKKLIDGLDLDLPPGERLLVQGPTASGKSLLVDALYGLRPLYQGAALLDGASVADWQLDLLRDQVCLLRGVELLEGTILDNLRLGRHEVDLQGVHQALDALGLLDAVLELPNGLHTWLTPEGRPLSDAQLRLLAVARAVLGKPRLLIVDQTLDGLDSRSREAALDLLCPAEAPWTLILVSNLPEAAARCHRGIDLAVLAAQSANKLQTTATAAAAEAAAASTARREAAAREASERTADRDREARRRTAFTPVVLPPQQV